MHTYGQIVVRRLGLLVYWVGLFGLGWFGLHLLNFAKKRRIYRPEREPSLTYPWHGWILRAIELVPWLLLNNTLHRRGERSQILKRGPLQILVEIRETWTLPQYCLLM